MRVEKDALGGQGWASRLTERPCMRSIEESTFDRAFGKFTMTFHFHQYSLQDGPDLDFASVVHLRDKHDLHGALTLA